MTPVPTDTPTLSPPLIELYSALPNPVGTDPGNEKITLINKGGTSADLAGWKIKDAANNTVNLSGMIGGGETATFTPSGAMLNNSGGDTLHLFNDSLVEVDTASYGTVTEGEVVLF
jgi:hypothetical protein